MYCCVVPLYSYRTAYSTPTPMCMRMPQPASGLTSAADTNLRIYKTTVSKICPCW